MFRSVRSAPAGPRAGAARQRRSLMSTNARPRRIDRSRWAGPGLLRLRFGEKRYSLRTAQLVSLPGLLGDYLGEGRRRP